MSEVHWYRVFGIVIPDTQNRIKARPVIAICGGTSLECLGIRF